MRSVLVLLVLLLGIVAVFAFQNPGIVAVNFLHLSANTSLLAIITVSFAAGVVAGILVGIPSAYRRRSRVRELEAEVARERAKAEDAARRANAPAEPPPPPAGIVP